MSDTADGETDDEIHGAPDVFAPGALVVDRDLDADESADADSDRSAMVVAATGDRADSREFAPGKTVASANAAYPPEDEVVSVVFTSELDAKVPKWDAALARHRDPDDETDIREWLADYRHQWGVDLKTYSYPHSRLRPLTDDDVLAAFLPDPGVDSESVKERATEGWAAAPDDSDP